MGAVCAAVSFGIVKLFFFPTLAHSSKGTSYKMMKLEDKTVETFLLPLLSASLNKSPRTTALHIDM